MNWREDYAKEASQNARAAFREGKGENPYIEGSMEHRMWNDSWNAAQESAEKRREEDEN